MTNSNYFEIWKKRHGAMYRAVYGAAGGNSNSPTPPPPVPPKPTFKYKPIRVPGLDGNFVFMMTNTKYDLNEQSQKEYIDWVDKHSAPAKFGCSGAVYRDYSGKWAYHARNMDWYYDSNVSMVNVTPEQLVKDGIVKYASIGMCLCRCNEKDLYAVGTAIKPEVKLIPYFIDDGINSAGLSIQMNVIPYKKGVCVRDEKRCYPDRMACRYVLDNFGDPKEAATWIAENCYYSGTEFNYHWIVSNKDIVVLVEDGQIYDISRKPYMTNFRCANADQWYDDQKERISHLMHEDPYGMGLERYDFIQNHYSTSSYYGKEDAFKIFNSIWYSNAYRPRIEIGDNCWWTETCANYKDFGIDYTVQEALTNKELREKIYDKVCKDAMDQGKRRMDHGKWQTTWNAVFDRSMSMPRMHIKFQETNYAFTFNLDGTMIAPVGPIVGKMTMRY